MKKITITLGNNESKFTAIIDDVAAAKIFSDAIRTILGGEGNTCHCDSEHEVLDAKRSPSIDSRSIKDILRKPLESEPKTVWNEPMNIEPFKPKESSKREPYVSKFADKTSAHFAIEDNKAIKTVAKSSFRVDSDRKYLCYYKCVECGSSFFKMASHGDNLQCSCGHSATIEHFTQSIYECACCGFKGFFKAVNGSEVSEVVCKGCESPIDMKYHDDKRQWLSLNMFK